MDTAYLSTSYSYDDKDYFEPSVAVLPTPCGFQQPQHGHLYPIVSSSLHPLQGSTHLSGNEQYDHSISIQPSMFYYAAAAASAGPSLISQQQDPQPQPSMQNKATIDEGAPVSSQRARKRGTKRGRPTKNPVWTFFRRIDDKSVQCNMCARLVKSACATNMSKHLERHHQNAASMTTSNAIDIDFGAQKYDQPPPVLTNYDVQHPPTSWNSYQAPMQPLKHVIIYAYCRWSPATTTIKEFRRHNAIYPEYHGTRTDEALNEIAERNIRCGSYSGEQPTEMHSAYCAVS
ncbi:hypothetical protein Q1695_007529 [Nippostrongylus brasiliensis]|nr:hypothetical protein Q1695_007529 [Nippostrongylus brasiliensis]